MPPPGATTIASDVPSGDHFTSLTGSSSAVTIMGHPPSTPTVHTCGTPLRLERKANRLPSGEKLGEKQEPMRAIEATDVRRVSTEEGAVLSSARSGLVKNTA